MEPRDGGTEQRSQNAVANETGVARHPAIIPVDPDEILLLQKASLDAAQHVNAVTQRPMEKVNEGPENP